MNASSSEMDPHDLVEEPNLPFAVGSRFKDRPEVEFAIAAFAEGIYSKQACSRRNTRPGNYFKSLVNVLVALKPRKLHQRFKEARLR